MESLIREAFVAEVGRQTPEVRQYLDEVASLVYAKYAGAAALGAASEFVHLMQQMTTRFEIETEVSKES